MVPCLTLQGRSEVLHITNLLLRAISFLYRRRVSKQVQEGI